MCIVIVLINGKNNQNNVKNRQEKLNPMLKGLGHAIKLVALRIRSGFTHHSLDIVTRCPGICHFHFHKITGSCSIDFIDYFNTTDYDGWCPKEM